MVPADRRRDVEPIPKWFRESAFDIPKARPEPLEEARWQLWMDLEIWASQPLPVRPLPGAETTRREDS